jgi:hypothetical protein
MSEQVDDVMRRLSDTPSRAEIGFALMRIRDGNLYQPLGYRTFEQYVNKKWGMSRARAYALIRAAESETSNEREIIDE